MVSIAFKAAIIRNLTKGLISQELTPQETMSLINHFDCMQTLDATIAYGLLTFAGIWLSLGGDRFFVLRLPFVSAFVGLTALHREAIRHA